MKPFLTRLGDSAMRQFAALLALSLAVSVIAAPLPDKQTPAKLEVKLRDPKDSYTVAQKGRDTILEIRSPKGISMAAIRRLGDRWPDSVIVRLRLAYLENLDLHHDKVSVAASVGWSDKGLRMRQWALGNERAVINSTHPLYLPIRLLDREGQPATRGVEDGWFEIPLPAAFFEGNPETIHVAWIDAYRN